MRHRLRTGLVLCLLAPLAGTMFRAAAQDSASVRPQRGRADANLITRDQFDPAAYRTAWEIVEVRRPNWLRQRPGGTSFGPLTGPASDSAAPSRPGSAMPSSLSPRRDDTPSSGSTGVQVYLDGMRLGDLEELRNIPAAHVQSIRRLSGSEAQFRFGIGHSEGALLVSTHPE